MDKVRVGITIGDINGIGPEVIIKGLYPEKILEMCTPVIYGNSKVVSYHKNVANFSDFTFHSLRTAERLNPRKVNVLNCWEETANITLGQATEESGKYAYVALDRAVRDLTDGLIDVLVTGPVNKHAMHLVDFPSTGHTDYLEIALGGEALMIMVSDTLRVGMLTGHVPLKDVAEQVTAENVEAMILRFIKSLEMDFGLERPTIAVLGLNPHASDRGVIGTEENEIITPVIVDLKKRGNLVMGPYSADGFFGSGLYSKFDGILAMYHDQGLIPFKSLSFGHGVNYTAGLPYVRTSPDHGTAYDLAGKNEADEKSFRSALYLAIDIFNHRKNYKSARANSIRNEPRSPEHAESND